VAVQLLQEADRRCRFGRFVGFCLGGLVGGGLDVLHAGIDFGADPCFGAGRGKSPTFGLRAFQVVLVLAHQLQTLLVAGFGEAGVDQLLDHQLFVQQLGGERQWCCVGRQQVTVFELFDQVGVAATRTGGLRVP